MKRPCFSSKQSMSAATSYTTALGCTRIALIPSVLQVASVFGLTHRAEPRGAIKRVIYAKGALL